MSIKRYYNILIIIFIILLGNFYIYSNQYPLTANLTGANKFHNIGIYGKNVKIGWIDSVRPYESLLSLDSGAVINTSNISSNEDLEATFKLARIVDSMFGIAPGASVDIYGINSVTGYSITEKISSKINSLAEVTDINIISMGITGVANSNSDYYTSVITALNNNKLIISPCGEDSSDTFDDNKNLVYPSNVGGVIRVAPVYLGYEDSGQQLIHDQCYGNLNIYNNNSGTYPTVSSWGINSDVLWDTSVTSKDRRNHKKTGSEYASGLITGAAALLYEASGKNSLSNWLWNKDIIKEALIYSTENIYNFRNLRTNDNYNYTENSPVDYFTGAGVVRLDNLIKSKTLSDTNTHWYKVHVPSWYSTDTIDSLNITQTGLNVVVRSKSKSVNVTIYDSDLKSVLEYGNSSYENNNSHGYNYYYFDSVSINTANNDKYYYIRIISSSTDTNEMYILTNFKVSEYKRPDIIVNRVDFYSRYGKNNLFSGDTYLVYVNLSNKGAGTAHNISGTMTINNVDITSIDTSSEFMNSVPGIDTSYNLIPFSFYIPENLSNTLNIEFDISYESIYGFKDTYNINLFSNISLSDNTGPIVTVTEIYDTSDYHKVSRSNDIDTVFYYVFCSDKNGIDTDNLTIKYSKNSAAYQSTEIIDSGVINNGLYYIVQLAEFVDNDIIDIQVYVEDGLDTPNSTTYTKRFYSTISDSESPDIIVKSDSKPLIIDTNGDGIIKTGETFVISAVISDSGTGLDTETIIVYYDYDSELDDDYAGTTTMSYSDSFGKYISDTTFIYSNSTDFCYYIALSDKRGNYYRTLNIYISISDASSYYIDLDVSASIKDCIYPVVQAGLYTDTGYNVSETYENIFINDKDGNNIYSSNSPTSLSPALFNNNSSPGLTTASFIGDNSYIVSVTMANGIGTASCTGTLIVQTRDIKVEFFADTYLNFHCDKDTFIIPIRLKNNSIPDDNYPLDYKFDIYVDTESEPRTTIGPFTLSGNNVIEYDYTFTITDTDIPGTHYISIRENSANSYYTLDNYKYDNEDTIILNVINPLDFCINSYTLSLFEDSSETIYVSLFNNSLKTKTFYLTESNDSYGILTIYDNTIEINAQTSVEIPLCVTTPTGFSSYYADVSCTVAGYDKLYDTISIYLNVLDNDITGPDISAPVLEYSNPNDGRLLKSDNVTVKCEIEDRNSLSSRTLYYKFNAGAWNNSGMVVDSGDTYKATITANESGKMYYYIISTDNDGIGSQTSSTYPVSGYLEKDIFLGSNSPTINTITLHETSPYIPFEEIPVTITVSDNNMVREVTVNGFPLKYNGTDFSGKFIGDTLGIAHNLKVVAVDNDFNVTSDNSTVYAVTTTAASIDFLSTDADTYYGVGDITNVIVYDPDKNLTTGADTLSIFVYSGYDTTGEWIVCTEDTTDYFAGQFGYEKTYSYDNNKLYVNASTYVYVRYNDVFDTNSQLQTITISTFWENKLFSQVNVVSDSAPVGQDTITFMVSETLLSNPTIYISPLNRNATFYNKLSDTYYYTFLIYSSDTVTIGTATISGTDAYNNEDSFTITFSIDPVDPVVSGISFSDTPAGLGYLTIDVLPSEPLSETPTVQIYNTACTYVTNNNDTYIFIYNITENDTSGTTSLEIEMKDISGNINTDSMVITIDSVKPLLISYSFSADSISVGNMYMYIQYSETLSTNPIILMNGSTMTFQSSNNLNDTYLYSVTRSDTSGTCTIEITLTDSNDNTYETTVEGFYIYDDTPSIDTFYVTPTPTNIRDITVVFSAGETLDSPPIIFYKQDGTNCTNIYSSIESPDSNTWYGTIPVQSGYNGTGTVSVYFYVVNDTGNYFCDTIYFFVEDYDPQISNITFNKSPRTYAPGEYMYIEVLVYDTVTSSVSGGIKEVLFIDSRIITLPNISNNIYGDTIIADTQLIGNHAVTFIATDSAGNSDTNTSFTYTVESNDGNIIFVFDTPDTFYGYGASISIEVYDEDLNRTSGLGNDTVEIYAYSSSDANGELIELNEDNTVTGKFKGTLFLEKNKFDTNQKLYIQSGDTINIRYYDELDSSGTAVYRYDTALWLPYYDGSISLDKANYVGYNDSVTITVTDIDEDKITGMDSITVTIYSSSDSNGFTVYLFETATGGSFSGTVVFENLINPSNDKLYVTTNDTIWVKYIDQNNQDNEQEILQASASWNIIDARILFVDDDGGNLTEIGYKNILDQRKLSYTEHSVENLGEPSYNIMKDYDLVIWILDIGRALSDSTVENIKSYLNNHGNMLLFGEDILGNTSSDFVTNYLHIQSYATRTFNDTFIGIEKDNISDSIALSFTFGSQSILDTSDDFTPDGVASGFLTNDGTKYSALKYSGSYRIIFYAFPFQYISNNTMKDYLMYRCVNWLVNLPYFYDIDISPNPALHDTNIISFRTYKSFSSDPIVKVHYQALTKKTETSDSYEYYFPVDTSTVDGDTFLFLSGYDNNNNYAEDNSFIFYIDSEQKPEVMFEENQYGGYGSTAGIVIYDTIANKTFGAGNDSVFVHFFSSSDGDGEKIYIYEHSSTAGLFIGGIGFSDDLTSGDTKIKVVGNDVISGKYTNYKGSYYIDTAIWSKVDGTVLLVDDDNNSSYEDFYQDALDANEISYTTYNVYTSGNPSLTYLQQFDIVIWAGGAASSPTAEKISLLESFLAANGKLFISHQDFVSSISDTFLKNYLKINNYTVRSGSDSAVGIDNNVISDGMDFRIYYPSSYYNRVDNFTLNGSTGIFKGENNKYIGLQYELGYRVVLISFPYEYINSDVQSKLLERVINYLLDVPVVYDQTVTPDRAPKGDVTITFKVNKTLSDTPTLTINSNSCTGTAYDATEKKWTFSYTVREVYDTQGEYKIYISVTDTAGKTTLDFSETIYIDPVDPYLTSCTTSIETAPQGILEIKFKSSELLYDTYLSVKLNDNACSLYYKSDTYFIYRYLVSETDVQGAGTVTISGSDVLGNDLYETCSQIIESIAPNITGMNVSQDSVTYETLYISIEYSEVLSSIPYLYINGSTATAHSTGTLSCTYIYYINFSDTSGTALIKTTLRDVAGNTKTETYANLYIDTIKPTVTSIKFDKTYVSSGTVTIILIPSETLPIPPEIYIKYDTAVYQSLSGNTYTYEIYIDTDYTDGETVVYISMYDYTGNHGEDSTNTIILDQTPPDISFDTRYPDTPGIDYVYVEFTVNETLSVSPAIVSFSRYGEITDSTSMTSFKGRFMIYDTDTNGAMTLVVSCTDLATNCYDTELIFNIDTIRPAFNNISLDKDTTGIGIVFVTFEKAEDLLENPEIIFNGRDGTYFAHASGLDTYIYYITVVDSDPDGYNEIIVGGTDIHNNYGYDTKLIYLDTSRPSFTLTYNSNLVNPGDTLILYLKASETLSETPTVTINGLPCTYVTGTGIGSDTYYYVISSNDANGTSTIVATGKDILDNTGSSTFTNVVIDVQKPTISNFAISADRIAVGTLTFEIEVSEGLNSLPQCNILNRTATLVSNSAETFSYTFNTLASDTEGTVNIEFQLIDLAGNINNDTNNSFVLDLSASTVSYYNYSPEYTNGESVYILFSPSETLGDSPALYFNNDSMTYLKSEAGNRYYYYKTISSTDDIEGTATVKIYMTDLVGNADTVTYFASKVDFTDPETVNINTDKSIAPSGQVIINVDYNEKLSYINVYVNNNSTNLVSADDLISTYSYQVTENDIQGTANIRVVMIDMAGNQITDTGYFVISSVPPEFTNFRFSKNPVSYDTVLITFNVSNYLETHPTVVITGNDAVYYTNNDSLYYYRIVINDSFTQGSNEITVSGTDMVGNFGLDTDLSFVVDTVDPYVDTIVYSKNPINSDTLYFTLYFSEPLYSESTPFVRIIQGTNNERVELIRETDEIFSGKYFVLSTADGTANLKIYDITDNAYNTNTDNKYFFVDTQKPLFNIGTPSEDTVTSIVFMNIYGYAEVNSVLYINSETTPTDDTTGYFEMFYNFDVGQNKLLFKVVDVAGNITYDTKFVTYRPIVYAAHGGTIYLEDNDTSPENNTNVGFSADGVIDNIYVEITKKTDFQELSAEEVANTKINPLNPANGGVYEIKILDLYKKYFNQNVLKKPAKLTLRYDETLYPGEEESLRIFFWDGVKWVLVGGSVDETNNTVYAYVSHFSIYGVFLLNDRQFENGEITSVSPNPFTPNQDGINDIVQIIINVANYSELYFKIYDRRGKVIKELTSLNNGTIYNYSWDGRDESGELCETGLYFYQMYIQSNYQEFGVVKTKKNYSSGVIVLVR